MRHGTTFLVLAGLATGCGDTPMQAGDGAPGMDLDSGDLAMADQVVLVDLATPDAAMPDVAMSDLSSPPELTIPADLAIPPDLTPPPDLAPPLDLAPPPDLALADLAITDQAAPPDLAPPVDQATNPDLSAVCVIGGVTYPEGAVNPADSCQSCRTATSRFAWSIGAPEGSACGTGKVCHVGNCTSGCYVGGAFYSPNAANPAEPCQTCQPAQSTTTFTGRPDGTGCASGKVCTGAVCTAGCYIGGMYYASAAPNPGGGCQACQPDQTTTAWTTGMTCNAQCVYPQNDPQNCGACGKVCSGCATTCLSGQCLQQLATGQANPRGIAVDASNVYWANYRDGSTTGTINKLPVGGGTINVMVVNEFGPDPLVLDATTIYWIDVSASRLRKIAKGGGSATNLVGSAPLQGMAGPATGGGYVYFTGIGTSFNNYTDGAVFRVPGTGGSPTMVASNLPRPFSVAVDASNVYWINGGTAASSYTDQAVMKMSLGGGAPVALASGLQGVNRIAVDATHVYWTTAGTGASNYTDGTAVKVPIAGGATVTLATGLVNASDAVIDGSYLYLRNVGNFGSFDGAVLKVPTAGGAPITLASGQDHPRNIAVDASCVYWDTDTIVVPNYLGTVMRANK